MTYSVNHLKHKINVRIYRCQFESMPVFNSRFKDHEIEQLFEIVNALWQQASIKWVVRSIQYLEVGEIEIEKFKEKLNRKKLNEILINLSPKLPGVMENKLWKICLLSKFPIDAGGVYLPKTRTIFFSEMGRFGLARAAVLAHELGHSLGLIHENESCNLMNPESLRYIQKKCDNLQLKGSHAIGNFLTSQQMKDACSQIGRGPKQSTAFFDFE